MKNKQIYREFKAIPTQLTEEQFNLFVFGQLSKGRRGPRNKLSFYKIFNYILKFIHTGVQWRCLPIQAAADGKPEINFISIYRVFCRWVKDGSLLKVFESSVIFLAENKLLDTRTLHGDGTTTAAKKGGDAIGYSGHKHQKGEKVIAITDKKANIVAVSVVSPANENESILLPDAFCGLKSMARIIGINLSNAVMSLDSAYDSRKNRKMIFNNGMIPNIKENKRNRKKTKRGPKRIYDEKIFQERFYTVERVFAWEDKFKRLLMRFERISINHYCMKLIAYTMINLRHFCAV